MLINQWANVIRWEMRTRPFLRTSEFLWQEGHTAHETEKEAEKEARKMLGVYKKFTEDYLAMSLVDGKKSEKEKFAGAKYTYTLEGMMQDGKALQCATSHNLGQNFAKAFDVTYYDREGNLQHVHQTSWGMSTRIMGGLIMIHSDDKGLVLPPKIAPIHMVIIPILKDEENNSKIFDFIKKIKTELRGVGVLKIDYRENITPGSKFHEWEKKGVPLRLEVGMKDVNEKSVVMVLRDTGEKMSVKLEKLKNTVRESLKQMQERLYEKSMDSRLKNTYSVDTWKDFVKRTEENKFVMAHWCGEKEVEEKIKVKTKATIRCLPFDQPQEEGKCIYTGKLSKQRVLFAKEY